MHQETLWFFLEDPTNDSLEYIARKKSESTPEIVCGSKSQCFLKFVQNVYALDFYEEPDYFCLQKILLDVMEQHGLPITNNYDWMKQDLMINIH